MSNARELAQIPSTPSGRRNLIINGAMQVAQRGTQSNQAGHFTACDRFDFRENGSVEVTTSQDTDVPSGQGFANSLKIDVTNASGTVSAGNYALVRTLFEGQDLQHLLYGTSGAKKLTLSFWVKSAKTGTHIVELVHSDATYYNSISYTVNSANTWEHKSVTFDGYQTTNFDNDVNRSLDLRWFLMTGSDLGGGTLTDNTWHNVAANQAVGQVNVMDSTSNNFYLTGVQLEVGSVATEFEHLSYGEELALCQRYFFKLNFPQTTTLGTAYRGTTNTGRISLICPVPLRTLPSINSTNQPTLRFWWDAGSNVIVSTDGSLSVRSSSLDIDRFILSCINATGLGNNIGSVWVYSGELEISAEL